MPHHLHIHCHINRVRRGPVDSKGVVVSMHVCLEASFRKAVKESLVIMPSLDMP